MMKKTNFYRINILTQNKFYYLLFLSCHKLKALLGFLVIFVKIQGFYIILLNSGYFMF